jgi:hypothetical protein
VFELITITLTGVPELFKGYFAAKRQPHGNTTEPEGARPEAQGMRSKKIESGNLNLNITHFNKSN